MRRWVPILLLALVAAIGVWQRPGQAPAPTPLSREAGGLAGVLPLEAQATLDLIQRGGPFPFRKDGSVFQNREHQLPDATRGYYHEYTVPTPGSGDRGARRVVAGGNPPVVYYYTDDHYRSFRRVPPQ